MEDSRNHRAGGDGASMVDWTRTAAFDFVTEVDALETLQELGDELRRARRQVEETMRYLRAAVRAARINAEGITSAEAIIRESGLARRTVYGILNEDGGARS